ncbi:MAG: Dabb family protein [Bacteroidia bacterium]|nr:Dabb family protein [Bacteroidia bacterium]
MINHVVLFKLKSFETEAQKIEAKDKVIESLLALKNKISEIRHIEVGGHHQLEDGSFDICLISHFDSLEGLQAYQIHPEHLKVVDIVRANASDRAVVDFQF